MFSVYLIMVRTVNFMKHFAVAIREMLVKVHYNLAVSFILPDQFCKEGLRTNLHPNSVGDVPFQYFEEFSPSIEAAVRLHQRCSERTESGSGDVLTTHLLVSSSRIGCLIGKGGSIVTEMRRSTRANIRILSKDNLPKVATLDDEMVQVICCFY
jgi:KH domain